MAEREILFRGKRMDNMEWINGFLFISKKMYYILPLNEIHYFFNYIKEGEHLFGSFIEVVPETVGQYTGLKDKNGVKIFEGDIVSYFNKDILNSEVIYKNGCFMFKFISEYTQRMRQTKQEPIFNNVSVCGEIIGNIHDNSELLKGA